MSIDLNLLIVFDAVAQEQSLTRAGQRLGLSQPAMSHALARLRHMLKDDLFVRTPTGMHPTPRAERMIEPVRAALQDLRATLEIEDFDAEHASNTFVIAVNNHAARAVVPAAVQAVARRAPSVVLDVRPIGRLHVLDLLDSGDVQLALDVLTEGGDRFKCVGLLDDEYVAVLARDHPAAAAPTLSMEQFAALPHIGITSGGDDTRFVDTALGALGLARRVAARVPLHALVSVLVNSEALAVMPGRSAAELAAVCPLVIRPLPFSSPRIGLAMIWHRRLDNHPAHRWLRETLRSAIARS